VLPGGTGFGWARPLPHTARRVHPEGWTLGMADMHAIVGDRLHVHSRVTGASNHKLEIVEIRGPGGAPPYLVRRDNGHEALVFPGADTSVEHRQNRESNWVDRLAPVRFTGWGVDPKPRIGGIPDHRWSINAARLPKPKELTMSPRKAGKPKDAATLARPPAHSTSPVPGGDPGPVQDGGTSQSARTTSSHRTRLAGAPRVGRPRNSVPAPFDDPCNYLG